MLIENFSQNPNFRNGNFRNGNFLKNLNFGDQIKKIIQKSLNLISTLSKATFVQKSDVFFVKFLHEKFEIELRNLYFLIPVFSRNRAVKFSVLPKKRAKRYDPISREYIFLKIKSR